MQASAQAELVVEADGAVLSSAGLLDDENVLVPMQRWIADGQRVALVTLVGVEGVAPRAPGSQMAVAADGSYAGYLSGGCIERAIVVEAQQVLAERCNRLVRYGKGSPYFDVRLPCGSGLDLYFDQGIDFALLSRMRALQTERRPYVLETDLQTGHSGVRMVVPHGHLPESSLVDGVFKRAYPPQIRLALIGEGPALVGLVQLAAGLGSDLIVATDDEEARRRIGTGAALLPSGTSLKTITAKLDAASAAILCYHAHEKELDVLVELVRTEAFFIGAIGNRAVHRARLELLDARGLAKQDVARIRGPVGAIPGAKSKATFAVGVLAEVMAEAKARNLVG